MILHWLRQLRRRRLRQSPFPPTWETALQANLFDFRWLNEAERRKLRGDMLVFIAEKHWEGCGGLKLTDEIKVTIAAQACLLTLAYQDEYFELTESILVYPTAYVAPDQSSEVAGVVLEGQSPREGEAWYRGPVVLSWEDALAGGRRRSQGHNLVIHEFAHQLDMQYGREASGARSGLGPDEFARFRRVMLREARRLESDCEQGRPTLLDCYGTTDLAEFFAVASECFFMRAPAMQRRHPALYEALRTFYRQDPAARRGPSPAAPPGGE